MRSFAVNADDGGIKLQRSPKIIFQTSKHLKHAKTWNHIENIFRALRIFIAEKKLTNSKKKSQWTKLKARQHTRVNNSPK